MAKEISELSSKTTPAGTDEIEIQETGGGTSKKTTLADVWANIDSEVNSSVEVTVTGAASVAISGEGKLGGTANNGGGVTGFGTTYDSFLGSRGGGVALAVLANSLNASLPAGNLVIGTSGKGIDFSATSDPSGSGAMTSELLDDYEEGTFTPALEHAAGSGTVVYSKQDGDYSKIGNTVTFTLDLQTSDIASRTGTTTIIGLPYTSAASMFGAGSVGFCAGLGTAAGNALSALPLASNTKISLYEMGTGAFVAFTHVEWVDASRMVVGGHYYV